MTKSTVGWFGVREKYCSLAEKPWLISQIRSNEQANFSWFKDLIRYLLDLFLN